MQANGRTKITVILCLCISICLCLFTTNSHCAPSSSSRSEKTSPEKNGDSQFGVSFQIATQFDVRKANARLDALTIRLSTEPLNIKHLDAAVRELIDLQKEAKSCVEDTEKEYNDVNKKISELDQADTPNTLSADEKYLTDKKQTLSVRLSECRLFVLRSGEAITAFSETIQKHVTSELLRADATIWKKFFESPASFKEFREHFDGHLFYINSGITRFSVINTLSLIALIFIALFLGAALRDYVQEEASPAEEGKKKFTKRISTASSIIFTRNIQFFLVLSFIFIWLSVASLSLRPTNYFMHLTNALLAYLFFTAIAGFFFRPDKGVAGVFELPELAARTLMFRLKSVAAISVVGYVGYIILRDQSIPQPLLSLLRSIFITVLSINLIAVIWSLNRLPKLIYHHTVLRHILTVFLGLILISIFLFEWFGYHHLVDHILYAISLSLVCSLAAWFLLKALIVAIDALQDSSKPWQQHLHYHLGLRRHETLTELIWIRIVIYLFVWSAYIIFLLRIWGLSQADFRNLLDSISSGFTVANIQIIPSRIIFAFLLFPAVLLITRLARARLMQLSTVQLDRGAKEALSTIMGYAGFTLAVVVAMLLAGVNFTGLAIIAGALSVGIGFGLQNIVNNFVSGLVLLIERPIKIGDRIIVGGTEGFVRKISIRSTQIKTMSRSDVIVPNSELISAQVTNLMFKDYNTRIVVKVGVAYNSDVELVEKIIYKVADEHPEVIHDDEANKPLVLFTAFGDNALNFELWCVIKDVNKKYLVPSEMNFALNKEFKKHKIDIPYPQHDLHIRNWPDMTIAAPQKDTSKR